jgi:DNA-binding response OmpR family regulator
MHMHEAAAGGQHGDGRRDSDGRRAPPTPVTAGLSVHHGLLKARIGHRVLLYRRGGDSTVTGNVTWLSPAACDPGERAADMPRGTQSGGQAMRVLVTEDDEILATAVAAGLRREGMAVDVTLDGAAALEHLAVNRYDVVILDRDLPGVHGDDVCRALAAGRSETRVLMLTAARSVGERVEGLGLGADDYLPKPFDFAELVARIRALGRRTASPLPATLEHGDLSLDPARRVAVRAGRRLPLTTKELAVLECLLAAGGRPVPAEELLERVWDEAADPFTTTVKTTIGRLRAKLGDPPVIRTVRESGYRIGEP